jgi:Holliday junction DNA helicase RuvA
VAALGPDAAVVEVAGIGLTVQCAPGTLARLRVGDSARLSTSLIVREDSLTLYGFSDDDERAVFELLQTSSGVGPRLAQAVLATHPPNTVRAAIANHDVATLTAVPGIGKKGAERMILELRDKIGAVPSGGARPTAEEMAPVAPWRDQLQHALIGLGWSGREAEEAIDAVAADQASASAAEAGDVPRLLRAALSFLGRR